MIWQWVDDSTYSKYCRWGHDDKSPSWDTSRAIVYPTQEDLELNWVYDLTTDMTISKILGVIQYLWYLLPQGVLLSSNGYCNQVTLTSQVWPELFNQ